MAVVSSLGMGCQWWQNGDIACFYLQCLKSSFQKLQSGKSRIPGLDEEEFQDKINEAQLEFIGDFNIELKYKG